MSRFFPTACSGSGDWGAAGFKAAGDRCEVGLWFLRAGIEPLAVNLGAPIPVDPFTLFESGKIGPWPRSGKNKSGQCKGPRKIVLPGVQLLLTDAGARSRNPRDRRIEEGDHTSGHELPLPFSASCQGYCTRECKEALTDSVNVLTILAISLVERLQSSN
jgi:hypothetical protein